jgi:hypothetical protein
LNTNFGSQDVNFGVAEVIPLPPRGVDTSLRSSRVSGEFRLELLVPNLAVVNQLSVLVDLEGNGQPIFTGLEFFPTTNSQVVTLNYPNTSFPTLFGDDIARRPVHYVLRARTRVITTSGDEVIDSTPANFRFVIVDDVDEYIRNRQGQDNQPVLERDQR